MNYDELTALVRRVQIGVECSGWACDALDQGDVLALLAHIDAEPERLAAAVAREREEQREADVRSCPTCKGEGFMMRVRECPFCNDSTHDHECPTDEVKVYCACGAARIRATPLTATPLKDTLSAVEDERDHLKASLVTERKWHIEALERAKAAEAERDAALLRVSSLQKAWDIDVKHLDAAWKLAEEAKNRIEELEARVKELRQRILDSCPSPDEGGRIHAGGRIVCGQCHDSEVSHLRAQLAEAVEVLRGLMAALSADPQSELDAMTIHDFDSMADYTRAHNELTHEIAARAFLAKAKP